MIRFVIYTLINTFVFITLVNIFLMGVLRPVLSKKSMVSRFLVCKENHIDLQEGNSCSGYAIAYVLRHYDIPARGAEVYGKLPGKTASGDVYPREIKRMLEKQGFHVRYCAGNLNALKNEVSKGNPVIVLIRVRKGKRWLHCVPVVGYDEDSIFLAESLAYLANCSEKTYNRKLSSREFERLWNTSMLKMPLYTHTFYCLEKKREFSGE